MLRTALQVERPDIEKKRLNKARSNQRTGGFSNTKAYFDCVWNVGNTGVCVAGCAGKCGRERPVLHEAWTHTLHLCHPARMPGFSELGEAVPVFDARLLASCPTPD